MRDIFDDDNEKDKNQNDNEFARLLAESQGGKPMHKLKKGDNFYGEILSIGKEESFVGTGTPQDALIFTRELRDKEGAMVFKVGEHIKCFVNQITEGEIRVSMNSHTKAEGQEDELEDAFDMELPVSGKISEICKGGVRVQLGPKKLAFCPMGQIDLQFVTSLEDYIGKKFEFLITQYSENGRNIVVSRRKILELARSENEVTFEDDHKPGTEVTGRITRIEKYGAFAEIAPGIDGLIPISELSWARLESPSEVVKVGDQVGLKILKVEREQQGEKSRLRISLSLKQLLTEPWTLAPQKFPVGSDHEGVIERREPYGFFIRLEPGIVGLLPKSKMQEKAEYKNTKDTSVEHKKVGEKLRVRIAEMRYEERKISLALPSEGNSEEDSSWLSYSSSQKAGSTTGQLGSLGDLLKNAQTRPKK